MEKHEKNEQNKDISKRMKVIKKLYFIILLLILTTNVLLSVYLLENSPINNNVFLSNEIIDVREDIETTLNIRAVAIEDEVEPSSNLTFDDINIIEINGKQVSLPFKVEELGEKYSIGNVQGFEKKIPAIYYNNQCLAVIEFNNDNYITSIVFTSDSFKKNDIQIYGLSPNDNFEKVIDTIGIPNKQKELALIYEYENGRIYFGSENGTLGYNFLKMSIYGGIKNE